MSSRNDVSSSLSRARQARDLFDEALALDEAGREAFLAQACGDDVELKAEVRGLLASSRQTSTARLCAILNEMEPAATARETPSVAGNFRLGRFLGSGGMGAVYEAEHVVLREPVAVKLLHPHLAADPTSVARLLNEARAVNAIRHPHIVEVKDAGLIEGEGGLPYVVMELLRGESLAHRLRRAGPLPLATAVKLAVQVADALGAAHAAGVVHRDLKPENIFLCAPDDAIKVLDFGVAKLRGPLDDGAGLTRDGLLGTPRYMAPEQWRRGEAVNERTDIYALGLVVSEMLQASGYGAAPSSDGTATLSEVATRGEALPLAVTRVLARATAAEVNQRHPSMKAFAEDLEAAVAERPTRQRSSLGRRRRLVAMGAATAALALVGGWGWRAGRALTPRPSPAEGPMLRGDSLGVARPPSSPNLSSRGDRPGLPSSAAGMAGVPRPAASPFGRRSGSADQAGRAHRSSAGRPGTGEGHPSVEGAKAFGNGVDDAVDPYAQGD